jgi:nitroreductase
LSVVLPFEQLVESRRSVRGFRPEAVPQVLLDRIFGVARRAPSNCNAQPWITHVLSGDAAARLRRELASAAARGEPADPDIPITHGAYQGVYRARQIASAKALFAATGIAREDVSARTASMNRNYAFFDAPHVAFLFLPASLGIREAVDVGMYGQTLLLLLAAHGIASCAQGALSHYAGIVHRALGVPADQMLLFGIAFGYADDAHPANATRTERAPIEEAVVFHSA